MSKDILKTKSPMISRDREYLFNKEQNLELNTYVTWDEIVPRHDQNSKIEGLSSKPTSSVKSIFNKYTTVYKSDEYRIGNNVPLIDTPSIRETIKKKSDVEYKYKKQSGGHGQYGHVKMRFESSGDLETPFVFEQEVVGGAVPKNYFPAVEKGLQESVQKGPLAAYPVVGIKSVLYDGS